MPRPGSSVVHSRMLEQIRAVAEAAMSSRCQLRRPPAPGSAVFNPTAGTYTQPGSVVLWAGPCRVQPRSRGGLASGVAEAAGDLITLSDYQISIPISAPALRVDDVVHVVSGPDPQLIGRAFRVAKIAVGDLQAERQLTCQDQEA